MNAVRSRGAENYMVRVKDNDGKDYEETVLTDAEEDNASQSVVVSQEVDGE